MRKIFTLVLLCLAALFSSAAIAKADIYEDTFLQVMHEHGYWHAGGDTELILAGHQVCDDLAINGGNLDEAIAYVWANTDQSMTLQKSSYFVGASIGAFCPQYAPTRPGYVA
jgi:hypothetical protein